MARPIKKGLAYFPLDTDIIGNRKIQRLLLHFGGDGLSVYLSVLCDIYRLQGYYLPVNDELYFDLGFSLHIHEKQVKEIIRYCVKIHLFDSKMLKNKRILTSSGIQKRYDEVCKRTKNEVIKAYLLKEPEQVSTAENPVSVTITPQKDHFPEVSVTEMQQKEKEKEKEIKEKEEKNKSKKKNYGEIECEQSKIGPSQTTDDRIRQHELIRMARAATAGGRTDA